MLLSTIQAVEPLDTAQAQMNFTLIDRIIELKAGQNITAVKSLSLAEDYLGDHFPLFPVMPGVLMLEAMYEAAAWLVRVTENFAHSVILLQEARNVKYKGFVEPGQLLKVIVELVKLEDSRATVKARGLIQKRDGSKTQEETEAVSARLVLEMSNVGQGTANPQGANQWVINTYKERLALIWSPEPKSEHPPQALAHGLVS